MSYRPVLSARLSLSPPARSPLIPALAVVLGMAIFAVDTLTPLDTAVAVLYVTVVLLLADHLSRRGILTVGTVCICLTLISFVIMHDWRNDIEAIMRGAVSITAIVVTTLLSLRNRRSTDFLRSQAALLDLTHDAVLVRDDADTILYWNRGAEELYGWSAREALGRRTSELLKTVFPVSREASVAGLRQEARWEGELRHTRKDGSPVVVMSRWSMQHDERGQPVAIMETNNDITERKRSEDALRTAHAELAHVTRVATLGQLTASIAHEVNQPLAAVVTNGEACLRWLQRPEPDVPEALASVERMIANGRRASDVVGRLRALARRGDPDHLPLTLNETLEEALVLMDWERAGGGVALDLRLAEDLPPLKGDKVQLQQVIINLVINALQAMAGSTSRPALTIRSGMEQEEGGAMLRLDVSDNGPGVSPGELPLLFEPFRSSKPDGMGLGLSICRSIIEAHGGRIIAAPNPGAGLAIRVTLPVLREAP